MKRVMIMIFISNLCCTAAALAQGRHIGKIDGIVLDYKNGPIPSATVRLYKLPDSSLVKIVLTDSTGNYTFKGLSNADYYIRVSMLGMADAYGSTSILNNMKSNVILAPTIMRITKIKNAENTSKCS